MYPAPFAVNLSADDETYVEPDVSVICDASKLSERGCEGAPDLIVEVVSPSSRRMDYFKKADLYAGAGVREYWICDPDESMTTVYCYEQGYTPSSIPSSRPLPYPSTREPSLSQLPTCSSKWGARPGSECLPVGTRVSEWPGTAAFSDSHAHRVLSESRDA